MHMQLSLQQNKKSSSLPILEASYIMPVIASNTEPNLELGKYLKILLFKVSDFNDLKQKN